MTTVNDIFQQGPQAALDWIAEQPEKPLEDEMELKRLADDCWARASTLAKTQPHDARKWAKASLAGYEFLTRFGNPITAESASENAAALRSWNILAP